LIEINTNPCIEESSPLLQKLIPRNISIMRPDDAFRLTIDVIFPPPKPEMIDEILSDYCVPGYDNGENLWEPLGKLSK
jgi:tubulin---tyrosine ligase